MIALVMLPIYGHSVAHDPQKLEINKNDICDGKWKVKSINMKSK